MKKEREREKEREIKESDIWRKREREIKESDIWRKRERDKGVRHMKKEREKEIERKESDIWRKKEREREFAGSDEGLCISFPTPDANQNQGWQLPHHSLPRLPQMNLPTFLTPVISM